MYHLFKKNKKNKNKKNHKILFKGNTKYELGGPQLVWNDPCHLFIYLSICFILFMTTLIYCYIKIHSLLTDEMYSCSSFHYVFLAVFFRFQNYDIALWGKNAKEETKG